MCACDVKVHFPPYCPAFVEAQRAAGIARRKAADQARGYRIVNTEDFMAEVIDARDEKRPFIVASRRDFYDTQR
jgi:hypothetical protein